MMPSMDQIGLQRAQATLARATAFLGNGLCSHGPEEGAMAIVGPLRAKVIGNSLRELDRFLNLLIDELAPAILPQSSHAGFGRRRNTANKLRDIRTAMAVPSPDHARLRAIGRSRDCLFHCGGIVRRGDRRGDPMLTLAWRAPQPRIAHGERLAIGAEAIAELCDFYDGVATELMAAFARHRTIVDFSGPPSYIDAANVAATEI